MIVLEMYIKDGMLTLSHSTSKILAALSSSRSARFRVAEASGARPGGDVEATWPIMLVVHLL